MNQLLLGASFPFAIGLSIYLIRRCRASFPMLIAIPIFMVLSMLWAVAPDLPRMFGMRELYDRLTFDPRCDIFYWHTTIDKTETPSVWHLVGLVLVLCAVLFAAWRELYRVEKEV
jgi:hypothetical protein